MRRGTGRSSSESPLPIDPSARARFDARGDDAVRAAICGGDDYELLFTVRPRTRRRLTAAERHGGAPLTRIGTCTADRLVVLERAGASTPVPEGYSHFAP